MRAPGKFGALSFESHLINRHRFCYKIREVRDAEFFALIGSFEEKMTRMWCLRIPRRSAIGHVVAVVSVYGSLLSLLALAFTVILFCFAYTEELLVAMENEIRESEKTVALSMIELSALQDEIRQLLSPSKDKI